MIPRTPHLPGSRLGNDDLQVSEEDARRFRCEPVSVVEKKDGIGVGFRFNRFDSLEVVLKHDWATALGGVVLRSTRRWMRVHEDVIGPLVADGSVLLGEWMLHRLVVEYDHLPSAVIFHGIITRDGRVRPLAEVVSVVRAAGLAAQSPHFVGVLGDRPFPSLVPRRSAFGKQRPEGIIVERVDGDTAHRAKWVAPHYAQPWGSDLTGAWNQVQLANARAPRRTSR